MAPYSDHETFLLDDEKPVLYSMHVHHPRTQVVSKTAAPESETKRNGWFDLVEFAEA